MMSILGEILSDHELYIAFGTDFFLLKYQLFQIGLKVFLELHNDVLIAFAKRFDQ